MDECNKCNKPLGGHQVVKIIDGHQSLDDEFDPIQAETYHADCFASMMLR